MAAALPKISKCPRCGQPLWFYYGPDPSLIRWTFWTDGKNTQELRLEHAGYLRHCSLCREYFFERTQSSEELLSNLSLLESLLEPTTDASQIEPKPEIERADGEAKFPNLEQIYDGLETLSGELTVAQELGVRLRAWRLENDRVRDLKYDEEHALAKAEIYFSSSAVESLRRLFDLLDESQEKHRFYRAEIAREVDLFDVAISLFEANRFPKLAKYAARARVLAEQQNRYVANLAT